MIFPSFSKRILHICYSDSRGGASRAAYRVHSALKNHQELLNTFSLFRSIHKGSADYSVLGGKPLNSNAAMIFKSRVLTKIQKVCDSSMDPHIHRTLCSQDSGLEVEINDLCSHYTNIVNLHFLNDSTLSLQEISRIKAPIVWRLPDQWAFLGCIHYQPIDMQHRDLTSQAHCYIDKYAERPILSRKRGFDLDKLVYIRKQNLLKRRIYFVAPTRWMQRCLANSALFDNQPCTIIPTPIDSSIWFKRNRINACKSLGLDPNLTYLMFGAVSALDDTRKGSALLLESLSILSTLLDDSSRYHILIFGSTPHPEFNPPFACHYFGNIDDDDVLRDLYSCAELFLLPSIIDNLPGTGIEAHAMSLPVVGFDTGGLPDVVTHNVTGALATPFSARDFAERIYWCLSDRQRLTFLADSARHKAISLWDPLSIARRYSELYDHVLENEHCLAQPS